MTDTAELSACSPVTSVPMSPGVGFVPGGGTGTEPPASRQFGQETAATGSDVDQATDRSSIDSLYIEGVKLGSVTSPDEMSIRLSLPHLGVVQIKLCKNDGDAQTVTISASRLETLQSMIADQSQLRTALHEGGLTHGSPIEYTMLPVNDRNDGTDSFSRSSGDEARRQPGQSGGRDLSSEDFGARAASSLDAVITPASHAETKSINFTA